MFDLIETYVDVHRCGGKIVSLYKHHKETLLSY